MAPPFKAFRRDTLEKATNAGVRGRWSTTIVMDAERGYLIYRVNDADSLAQRATAVGSLIISQRARLVGMVWQEGGAGEGTLHAVIAAPLRCEHWVADILSKKKADVGEWSAESDIPDVVAKTIELSLNKMNPEAASPA